MGCIWEVKGLAGTSMFEKNVCFKLVQRNAVLSWLVEGASLDFALVKTKRGFC
jgi:hypothetical protein